MIPEAIALALTAAVLHATWNVLLKTSGDPLLTMARATAAAAAIFTPPAALAWLLTGRPGVPPSVWGLVAISSLAELAYAICLSAAYRRGELSAVYPIARGTAPLLAVPAGLLLGERLQIVNWAGVCCLLAGIWIVRRPARGQSSTLPALLTGVFIATYSAIDTKGVHIVAPWLYGWGIWIGNALLLQAWVWLWPRLSARVSQSPENRTGPDTAVPGQRTTNSSPGSVAGVATSTQPPIAPTGATPANETGHTRPQPSFPSIRPRPEARISYGSEAQPPAEAATDAAPTWGRAVAIGIPMTVGYLLVLVAFHLAPLIVVAPVRESAVVLVAGWSVWKLRERRQLWQRLIGTAAVLAGIVLVAI